jgi:antitoxin (DNA-binding transcriptional repressor) of toxin-antitoxin stability system
MTSSVVGVHEAETHPSRPLERGERGEVVAHLVAPPPSTERRTGLDVGRLHIADDFDAPLPGDVLEDSSS